MILPSDEITRSQAALSGAKGVDQSVVAAANSKTGEVSSHSPMRSNSIFDIHRQKKQADQDATLLANRILMLDNEQAKMLKKIEKTRR